VEAALAGEQEAVAVVPAQAAVGVAAEPELVVLVGAAGLEPVLVRLQD
jgi:hypothetical protein